MCNNNTNKIHLRRWPLPWAGPWERPKNLTSEMALTMGRPMRTAKKSNLGDGPRRLQAHVEQPKNPPAKMALAMGKPIWNSQKTHPLRWLSPWACQCKTIEKTSFGDGPRHGQVRAQQAKFHPRSLPLPWAGPCRTTKRFTHRYGPRHGQGRAERPTNLHPRRWHGPRHGKADPVI